ncbi:MAG: hypothetical protein NZ899_10975 [Thermoguttaceae bacterium]|nr:hypothetical protein [Thermoguttaceae bacterium]MDW8079153.1 hypothetical protein [Thermoguttaceae bacterium]
MDAIDRFIGYLLNRPELIAFFAAVIGSGVSAVAGLLGTMYAARRSYQAAKLQAEATIKAVCEEVERRYRARQERSRADLRERVERLSSRIVRPCERLLSRLSPLCKLWRLRCADFNPKPGQTLSSGDVQALRDYDRLAEMYGDALDSNADHPGANQRFTFIVYLFRALASIGKWRDQVVRVVALDDPLVAPAIYHIRRIEVALCSPRLPGKPWMSRDLLETIEDTLGPEGKSASWDRIVQKVNSSPQLRYAAKNVEESFFGIFDQSSRFMQLRSKQVRGGIIAIYLTDLLGLLLPEYDFIFKWDRDDIWPILRDFAKQQVDRGQEVNWYLYEEGDVLEKETCPLPPSVK